MLYRIVKKLFVLSVNILNLLLAGNLPPFVCVCVIVEEQGRFLVVESAQGRFTFPGGFVRWRELPVQAARREGKEETGMLLRINDVIGHYSCPSKHFRSASTLDIVFHAEVVGGELRSSIEGKPAWLDAAEVQRNMGNNAQHMFDDYLKHRCTARHRLEAVDLIEQEVAN